MLFVFFLFLLRLRFSVFCEDGSCRQTVLCVRVGGSVTVHVDSVRWSPFSLQLFLLLLRTVGRSNPNSTPSYYVLLLFDGEKANIQNDGQRQKKNDRGRSMSAANITTDKGNICDSRSSMVYYLFLLFFFPEKSLEEMQFILSNATPLLKFQTSFAHRIGCSLRPVRWCSFDAIDFGNI